MNHCQKPVCKAPKDPGTFCFWSQAKHEHDWSFKTHPSCCICEFAFRMGDQYYPLPTGRTEAHDSARFAPRY